MSGSLWPSQHTRMLGVRCNYGMFPRLALGRPHKFGGPKRLFRNMPWWTSHHHRDGGRSSPISLVLVIPDDSAPFRIAAIWRSANIYVKGPFRRIITHKKLLSFQAGLGALVTSRFMYKVPHNTQLPVLYCRGVKVRRSRAR